MVNKYEDLKWTISRILSSIEKDAGIVLPHESISFETKTLFTLWLFILIDKYSGFLAGWSHWSNRPKKDKSDQTARMIDFLERYLVYDREASKVAIKIWRHSLAHAAFPKIYRDGKNNYTWQWNYQNPPGFHWKLEKVDNPENTYRLYFGFYNLLNDLKVGLQKYCDDLIVSEELQNNYERCLKEIL